MKQDVTPWKYFPKKNTYFLNQQFEKYKITKPFRKLNILSNLHLTKATMCKMAPLIVSGANVTITATADLFKDKKIVDCYLKSGLYLDFQEAENYQYDIVLDCGAALINKIRPSLGFIELTKSTDLESIIDNPFNYVDIDKTKLKEIENLYGTGDGFVRALKSQSINIKNKSFLIFGYGKVGQGIAKALGHYTKDIAVVEINENKINKAIEEGFRCLNIENYQEIKKLLTNTFLAVTATGEKGIISKYYSKNDFKFTHKANMGTYDEWGDLFEAETIMGGKRPLNFTLTEPTCMKFLDPVFFAHNTAIELLIKATKGTGQILFPEAQDKKIIEEWISLHRFKI